MPLRDVKLDDKYDLGHSRVFVTGFQALVRLCLMQKELDRRNGLNTAGFVTGYRGSPLGNLDSQFLRARPFLDKYDIRFQGGINEDLAATAVWGSQQAELRGEGKYDGVFAMWYGKGPGVDRTGDAFRHANLAGSSKYGGVLALMGDDHTAESSTTAHQSEYHFIDVMIPVLNPAGVQEVLDYGLYGWAMSRFTGAWVALKTMHETIESTAAIDASFERINIVIPTDFQMPEGGLNIRLNDPILAQEARLHDFKRDAMLAFVRANKLNRAITHRDATAVIGQRNVFVALRPRRHGHRFDRGRAVGPIGMNMQVSANVRPRHQKRQLVGPGKRDLAAILAQFGRDERKPEFLVDFLLG